MVIPFIAAIVIIIAVIWLLTKASKKDNKEFGERGKTM